MNVYDLLIVGGGMSGISVAHFFRDQNILLLEKSSLLAGASGHNAGFLISGFGEHFSRTASRLGDARAKEILEIHFASHRRIADLAKKMHCGYKKTGSYALAFDSTELMELLRSYQWLRENQYSAEWIPSPPVGLKHSSDALFHPADARIDSIQFWSELARGIPIRLGANVREVEETEQNVVIRTDHDTFYAKRVVFCLNAYAANLVPELRGRYIPLRGQMLELPLLADPPVEAPIYMKHGDIYWRFEQERLIFGGLEHLVPQDEVGIVSDISAAILEQQLDWIRQNMREDIVDFGRTRVRSWASTMAFTVDGFPFVGVLRSPNQFVLSGLCGLGHSYAMEAASWLHELSTTGRNRIPAYCSSDRMNSLPVYQGGDWRKLYEAWNH